MQNKPKKITLIGYMASGKTTIGEALAKTLDRPFIDLDDYIAKEENLSISALFEQKGEDSFRKIEIKHLQKLLKEDSGFVLSLGGGTPTIENVMSLLTENSTCIYLKATVQTLAKRLLPNTTDRPLLNSITEELLESYIEEHLDGRIPYYEKATYSLTVDQLDINAVVNEIIELSHKD